MACKKSLSKYYSSVILLCLCFSDSLVLASQKDFSNVTFYGRLWVQYDNSDNSTSTNNKLSSIRDDEGNGRLGIKGKSSIINNYAINYKIEYAIDLGDGIATGDSKDCSSTADCRTFTLKQGWLGFLTPIGQFKFGSLESPYKSFAKHDILHDTISQARDTRMISQGSMAHSSYWRESIYYEFKNRDFKFAIIYGLGEGTSNTVTKDDIGLGFEYKNFLIQGFDIVYAKNIDNSVTGADNQDYNEKFTLTKTFILEDRNKLKLWYMHEDIGLDNKMFTESNADGEVDWYGIIFQSGPMMLQYSYAQTDAKEGSTYDRDGYNIGMQYKLSKSSRIYIGHSSSEAGSGDGVNLDIKSTMIGIRHDF